ILHLILRCGPTLDWQRLLRRFGEHWRVLLSHLVVFGFVYPGERTSIPPWVMDQLLGRVQKEMTAPPNEGRVCRGPLISRAQYLIDIDDWGYADARVGPRGVMSEDEVAGWTAAINSWLRRSVACTAKRNVVLPIDTLSPSRIACRE